MNLYFVFRELSLVNIKGNLNGKPAQHYEGGPDEIIDYSGYIHYSLSLKISSMFNALPAVASCEGWFKVQGRMLSTLNVEL